MRIIHLAMAAVAVAGLGASAQAATNLVVNGGFEITGPNGPNFEFDRDTTFPGWSSAGYNFGFAPGTADTTGSTTSQYGSLKLWGPANGADNGLTAASPFGGNFVAADGAFQTAAIYQQLSGLTAGKQYVVTFAYAGAQQFGFDGATTEAWAVNLGTTIPTDQQRRDGTLASTVQFTETLQNANHGFTGWRTASFTFTAQSANDFLSFLAIGTPDGLPPFTLLDGVTATAAVPEPATWGLMLVGFGLVGAAARRRSNIVAA